MLQCLSNRLLFAMSLVYLQIVPHCSMSVDCAVLCKCRSLYNAVTKSKSANRQAAVKSCLHTSGASGVCTRPWLVASGLVASGLVCVLVFN